VGTKDNVYARNQYVVFLAGNDRNQMQSAIRRQAQRLRHEIERKNRARVRDYLMSAGRDGEVERRIAAESPLRLRVPASYKLTPCRSEGDEGVIEIAATRPTRAVSVFYRVVDDPDILADRDRLIEIRRSWGERFLGENLQDEMGFEWRKDLLGDESLDVLAGFWKVADETKGGPFRTFFIHDPSIGRLYGINLLTYAPGMDKHRFMREAHAIAETFALRP
jgi:hypothetical protein